MIKLSLTERDLDNSESILYTSLLQVKAEFVYRIQQKYWTMNVYTGGAVIFDSDPETFIRRLVRVV